VLNALAQLERLRPVLSSIDSRTEIPGESLRAAVAEFDAIKLSLSPIQSGTMQEQLMKIVVLGRMAATTRLEAQLRGDASRAWNAASAAAGALMMLDRAAPELRKTAAPK
jgi:hypothetical protein